jgi:hypothetical protein
MVQSLFILVAVFAVTLASLLAMSIGVGILLHGWLPSIDFGISVLLGLVANITALVSTYRMFSSIWESLEEAELDEWLQVNKISTKYKAHDVLDRPRRRRKKPPSSTA